MAPPPLVFAWLKSNYGMPRETGLAAGLVFAWLKCNCGMPRETGLAAGLVFAWTLCRRWFAGGRPASAQFF